MQQPIVRIGRGGMEREEEEEGGVDYYIELKVMCLK